MFLPQRRAWPGRPAARAGGEGGKGGERGPAAGGPERAARGAPPRDEARRRRAGCAGWLPASAGDSEPSGRAIEARGRRALRRADRPTDGLSPPAARAVRDEGRGLCDRARPGGGALTSRRRGLQAVAAPAAAPGWSRADAATAGRAAIFTRLSSSLSLPPSDFLTRAPLLPSQFSRFVLVPLRAWQLFPSPPLRRSFPEKELPHGSRGFCLRSRPRPAARFPSPGQVALAQGHGRPPVGKPWGRRSAACCVRAVLGRPRGPRGPRQAGPGSSAGPDGEERASEPEAGRRAGAHLPRALHLHRHRGRSVCRESGFLQPPLECSEAAPCLPQGAYQKKKITSGDCSKPHNSFGWFGSGTPKVVPQVKFYL